MSRAMSFRNQHVCFFGQKRICPIWTGSSCTDNLILSKPHPADSWATRSTHLRLSKLRIMSMPRTHFPAPLLIDCGRATIRRVRFPSYLLEALCWRISRPLLANALAMQCSFALNRASYMQDSNVRPPPTLRSNCLNRPTPAPGTASPGCPQPSSRSCGPRQRLHRQRRPPLPRRNRKPNLQ